MKKYQGQATKIGQTLTKIIHNNTSKVYKIRDTKVTSQI